MIRIKTPGGHHKIQKTNPSHMLPSIAQSVCRWRAWCWRKSYVTTCSVVMVSVGKVERVEMLSSDPPLAPVSMASRITDSNTKVSQASQLRAYRLKTNEEAMLVVLKPSSLTLVCTQVAKISITCLLVRRVARDIEPRLNNRMEIMSSVIKVWWMNRSSSGKYS